MVKERNGASLILRIAGLVIVSLSIFATVLFAWAGQDRKIGTNSTHLEIHDGKFEQVEQNIGEERATRKAADSEQVKRLDLLLIRQRYMMVKQGISKHDIPD